MTTPQARIGDAGVRALGAGIGAGLAFVVLWSGWTAANRLDPGGAFGLETVLGRDGIAGGDPLGLTFAWATGPVAAGAAGWLQAPAAIGHLGRNGTNMGPLTYVIAIGIAPLAGLPAALSPTAFDGGLPIGSALSSIPFLWIASGIVLAPLLLACIAAGIAWAGLLGIARGPVAPVAAAEARRPSVALVVVLVGLLALAWLGGLWLFGSFLGRGGGNEFD